MREKTLNKKFIVKTKPFQVWPRRDYPDYDLRISKYIRSLDKYRQKYKKEYTYNNNESGD